jgi:hypothetical protein
MRSVTLFAESKINKNQKLNYSCNANIELGIKNINKNPKFLHNQLHNNLTNISDLGTETHSADVFFHKAYSSNYLINNNNSFSPETFFHLKGKYHPSSLNVSAPDYLKSVTSVAEVATVGFVSSKFPNTKIFQSNQLVNINFSKQPCPDSKLEILLNDGNIFTCWVDSKTMDFKVLHKYLNSLTTYRKGDTLKCNFY